MIGHLLLQAGVVTTTLVVSPFPPPETTVLSTLLSAGYEVKSSAGPDGTLLLLQKGTVLYACPISREVLRSSIANAKFAADQIQCIPFY